MAKKLFVGNLPWATTSEELRSVFEKVGRVETADVIRDKFTGKSRGFGFVEMASEEEAQKAIKELNGSKIGDRAIVVNIARPRR
ncbi:MAG: RNA-binding protein [Thermotogae bacterium]|nr:MAG: RNA-binding protein [Thermotogota bacterium]